MRERPVCIGDSQTLFPVFFWNLLVDDINEAIKAFAIEILAADWAWDCEQTIDRFFAVIVEQSKLCSIMHGYDKLLQAYFLIVVTVVYMFNDRLIGHIVNHLHSWFFA